MSAVKDVEKTPLKIGLALGSGGARGAAHTGVLKVLEREGIPISMISGSSIGSLVGAAHAAGVPVADIEREWLETGAQRVFRNFFPAFSLAGWSSGKELHKWLVELLGTGTIEELPMPYAAVACDIDSGESVVLREGPVADAVRASTAIPGVFHPMRYEDRFLVDGGLIDPVPVSVCRELGADYVIAVDITPRPVATTSKGRGVWNRIGEQLREDIHHQTWIPGSLTELLETVFQERPEAARPLPGLYSILNQSVSILVQEVWRQKKLLDPPDVLIEPDLSMTIMGYTQAQDGIQAGEQAAEAVLPRIRALLASEDGTDASGL